MQYIWWDAPDVERDPKKLYAKYKRWFMDEAALSVFSAMQDDSV